MYGYCEKVLYDTKLGNLKFHDNLFVVLYCTIYKMDLFCYTWLQSGNWHGTCSVVRGYSQEFDMGACSVIRGYSQEFDMRLVLLYVVTVRNLT